MLLLLPYSLLGLWPTSSAAGMMPPDEVQHELPRTLQAVEILPWWPLSPQIGHQSAPNTLLLGLLEPDLWSLPTQRRLFQHADFF
jgi:hypothetical protein